VIGADMVNKRALDDIFTASCFLSGKPKKEKMSVESWKWR
jgi:predicted metal-binding protein